MNSRASSEELITLRVNGESHALKLDPWTPLLYALRNDLGLKGPKYGCGVEQCGACKVLIDGADAPSCQLPVEHVADLEITTVEGLGDAENPHPLQAAFLEEQAAQCGFCSAGMIIAAQGLLNRVRYPSDAEIRAALSNNLCRCGIYDRVRRAIKLRIGRPDANPIYTLIHPEPVEATDVPAELSPSLQAHPDVDDWLRINDDGTITIFSGKVELGQGLKTALAQIAAGELDVALERIRVVMGDTERTPDEGGTTGSRSLETSGVAIRQATAEARAHMLELAFEQLESLSPPSELQARDGIVRDPRSGRQISYWDLMAGKRFHRLVSGYAALKPADQQRLVGESAARLDLLDKFCGGISYAQDLEMPGMLRARVLRPPGYHAELLEFDAAAIEAMPGVVKVLVEGQFIALAAEREEQAIRACEKAAEIARWKHTKPLPGQHGIFDELLRKPSQSQAIVDGVAVDMSNEASAPPPQSALTLEATYRRPFQMHASLGPSAALALWEDDKLTVWSHSQAPFVLRGALAQALQIDAGAIRVIHAEGAGCYGHNGADDVALDAALVALALPGCPIMMKWSRADEHSWEPYGSAMLMRLGASLNATGDIAEWRGEIWSYGHSTRPALGLKTSGLLASRHLRQPFAPQPARPIGGYHAGAHRNADPIYDLPLKRIVRHAVEDSPLRVSALRSLGAYANIFAIESFMDELAAEADSDPLDFRLRHLRDERARAVLLAAADHVDWPSRAKSSPDSCGWGMALAQYKNLQCYTAIVVKLRVDRESGEIQFERVVIAADAGQVVNPDGLSNQLEGGFAQAASWTLYEAVKFDARGITSLDWESYPILSFPQAPVIETLILNRPEMPFLGAGEAAQNPTPAAIANAIYDATGLRLREIPFTPETIKSALAADK